MTLVIAGLVQQGDAEVILPGPVCPNLAPPEIQRDGLPASYPAQYKTI